MCKFLGFKIDIASTVSCFIVMNIKQIHIWIVPEIRLLFYYISYSWTNQ